MNILFPELEKLVSSLHIAVVYALLSNYPGASYIANANTEELAETLCTASNGRYTKSKTAEIQVAAGVSIGSKMPAIVPAGDAGLYAQQHRQVAGDLFQSSPAREKRSGANKTTELIGRSTVPQITNLIKHSIMNVQIQSVKFDADRKLVEFVEHKMDKLDRFVERAIGADVILKLDKDHELGNKVATINLHIPGDDLVAESRGKSFEEAVDLSIEALKRQIDKYKGRLEK